MSGIKNLEHGLDRYEPGELDDIDARESEADGLSQPETAFGFALHVFDVLDESGQLPHYMLAGEFRPDEFMDEHIAELLRQEGIELTPAQVWKMASVVRFEVEVDTSAVDQDVDAPVSVAA